ncbi:MAG: hypothetical protein N2440_00050 [Actinobacteria bacterium]|nr:hypothetical protein [Actinomycetota bacterium]
MIKFALVGHPLSHTISPLIYKKIFEMAKIKGDYRIFEIPTRRLFYNICSELLENGYDGINVTIPYKVDAFYLSELKSDVVLRTQNANFLYLSEGKIASENTDYFGLEGSIRDHISSKRKAAAVIGYGGAARTCMTLLKDLSFERIFVVVRNKERALKSLKDFLQSFSRANIILIENPEEVLDELDLLVNATPAGMYPNVNELPFGSDLILKVSQDGMVLDLIYNPKETLLLKMAKERGIKVSNGLKMLVYQAVNAIEKVADINIDKDKLYISVENEYE